MNLPNRPTAYERMLAHHAAHQFKRGRNAGDAPLNTVQRYGHTLVRVTPTHADIILHQTAVMRAYPDGTITLASDRWRTKTTKDTINTALQLFARRCAGVYSTRRFGLSQWHLWVREGTPPRTYCFYDGIKLSPDGTPVDPKPFKRKRLNPAMAKAFSRAAKEFRQAFPILHAALPDTTHTTQALLAAYRNANLDHGLTPNLANAITSQPELWPVIIEKFAHSCRYTWGWYNTTPAEPATVLRAIMAEAKYHMYETVDSDTLWV